MYLFEGFKLNPNVCNETDNNREHLLFTLLKQRNKHRNKSLFNPTKWLYSSKESDKLLERIITHPKCIVNLQTCSTTCSDHSFIQKTIEFRDEKALNLLLKNENLFDPFDDRGETLDKLAYENDINLDLRTWMKTRFNETQRLNQKEAEDYYDREVAPFEQKQKEELIVSLKNFRYTPTEYDPKGLNDVGGMFKVKEEITKHILNPWNPNFRKQLKENQIPPPNGILFYGPPGCGKTYIAQAISAETGFPLYLVDLKNVGSKWGYETIRNLGKIFTALESQYKKTKKPSLLFLDEIDSIMQDRENLTTDWKRDDINALLGLLNNAGQRGILVLGATNATKYVDLAGSRIGRFDKMIEVPAPDNEARKDLLTKFLTPRKIASSLLKQINKIVDLTEGFSCSDIKFMCDETCRQAIFKEQEKIKMSDIENIVKEISSRPDHQNLSQKRRISFGR